MLVLIGGSWLIAVAGLWTGPAAALHQHAALVRDPAAWTAVPSFLLTWTVMIAAMMLPSSLPTVRALGVVGPQARPGLALWSFLGAYAAVWTAFGLAALSGVLIVEQLIDATPWLAERPWIVAGGVLALVGAYQFAPAKRRSLAACRHPSGSPPIAVMPRSGTIRLALGRGLAHGLDCVGSSGPLMLVMVAAGLNDLWWMVAFGAVMAYETMGRHGRRAASIVGVVLLWAAALVVLPGWLPSAAG